MNIAEFAERTGLVPSALRFYESQGVLLPAERMAKGYRRYSEDQIREAKLINSLRQSGVRLSDIRGSSSPKKMGVYNCCIIGVGKQRHGCCPYRSPTNTCHKLQPGTSSMHLGRWDEPVTMVWQIYTLV